VKNLEVAWILSEIADLLEIRGENQFKVRAYRSAARSIKHLRENIVDLKNKGTLRDIPGVGKNIAAKIEEILDTGKCKALEELRKEIRPELVNIIRLPGVGIKTARVIHEHLPGIDLAELEKAARKKKIRALPGLGPKTEQNIIRGIELLKYEREKSPLGLAMSSAEALLEFLASLEEVKHVEIGGSVRRGKDMVTDVDFVVSTADPQGVIQIFLKHPHIRDVELIEKYRVKAVTWLGVKVDLELVKEDNFIAVLHRSTGSRLHFEQLADFARSQNCILTGSEVLVEGNKVSVNREEDIYSAIGLPYIAPELREGQGEIEAAREGKLPKLLTLNDIKGDLHVHSSWSDGTSSIEELVRDAMSRGYSYIAITDHSKSLGIANGLSEERLLEQWKEIDRLRGKYAPFVILKGIEVDILSDFHLDLDNEVLAEMDIVIAAIHTGFKQDSHIITKRLLAALENPYVDVIAHPTGRILGRRPAYEFDFDRVIEKAAEMNAVLEINASPDRLDLNAEQVRIAKEKGVKIAINTDAHDKACLEDIKYGVITARRGWLERGDVLNTLNLEELLTYLSERKKRALARG